MTFTMGPWLPLLPLTIIVDLHAMEHGFPSRTEVPKDVDVRWLIADFGVTTNAIVLVVNVEQVIKDTPR
jgi:hypothetical protein